MCPLPKPAAHLASPPTHCIRRILTYHGSQHFGYGTVQHSSLLCNWLADLRSHHHHLHLQHPYCRQWRSWTGWRSWAHAPCSHEPSSLTFHTSGHCTLTTTSPLRPGQVPPASEDGPRGVRMAGNRSSQSHSTSFAASSPSALTHPPQLHCRDLLRSPCLPALR